MGVGLAQKKRLRDQQMFGRTKTNYMQHAPPTPRGRHLSPPTPSGHQREGREAEIGMEVAFTTQRAGCSGALDTGRQAFGGPGDWGGREGGGTGVRVCVGGEGGSGRPRRVTDRTSPLVFFCFRRTGRRRLRSPHYGGYAGRGRDIGIPVKACNRCLGTSEAAAMALRACNTHIQCQD